MIKVNKADIPTIHLNMSLNNAEITWKDPKICHTQTMLGQGVSYYEVLTHQQLLINDK